MAIVPQPCHILIGKHAYIFSRSLVPFRSSNGQPSLSESRLSISRLGIISLGILTLYAELSFSKLNSLLKMKAKHSQLQLTEHEKYGDSVIEE